MNRISKLILSSTFFILIYGCAHGNPDKTLSTSISINLTTISPTNDISPRKSITLIGTQSLKTTVIPTATSLLNSTQTPTKILILNPSATCTQASTPAPTLSLSQFRDKIFNLLSANKDCKLPCWWSITPGDTSWDETKKIFTEMGINIFDVPLSDGRVVHGLGGPYWNWNNTYINMFFTDQKDVISNINVDAEGYYNPTYFYSLWKDYSPETINFTYGPPSRILMGITGSETGKHYYGIYIFYDKIGILIYYKGVAIESVENGIPVYKICPTWKDPNWLPVIKIYLQSQDNNNKLDMMADINPEQWKSIDEAAEITTDDFYHLLLPGNAPACFYTPQDMWN
jgi:hypothetical protein